MSESFEHDDYLCGCGHEYPAELGRYGCPNCEGDFAGEPVDND